MDFLKSSNTLPFSQIYTAVSPIDRMSHLSLLITYGAKDHSCILSQMFCDNYDLFSSDTIKSLIKWAARNIRRIDPLAKSIYVCPRTQGSTVQLDIDTPYYETTDLGLIPTDKYETGSHHRWYYWSIDAN